MIYLNYHLHFDVILTKRFAWFLNDLISVMTLILLEISYLNEAIVLLTEC